MPGHITVDGWEEVGSGENRPLAVDLAPEMDPGDIAGSITSTLTDLLTGLSYPTGLSGSPSVVGTVATQAVTSLVPGHNYRLVLAVNMGGSKVTESAVKVVCPF